MYSGFFDYRTATQISEANIKYKQQLELETKRVRLLDNKSLACELRNPRYDDNYVNDVVLDEVQRRLLESQI